eukprot:scaffold11041_cov117-Cylindrotheca_fusiformis.AAC.2
MSRWKYGDGSKKSDTYWASWNCLSTFGWRRHPYRSSLGRIHIVVVIIVIYQIHLSSSLMPSSAIGNADSTARRHPYLLLLLAPSCGNRCWVFIITISPSSRI